MQSETRIAPTILEDTEKSHCKVKLYPQYKCSEQSPQYYFKTFLSCTHHHHHLVFICVSYFSPVQLISCMHHLVDIYCLHILYKILHKIYHKDLKNEDNLKMKMT